MIPSEPYKPWAINEKDFPSKGALEKKLRFLINYAVLAPSSHNTQPWLFRVGEKYIDIFPNFERALDYSDRTCREMYISIGCALANLLVAADYFGLRYKVNYLPESEIEDVAVKIKFTRSKTRQSRLSALFLSITQRRTNRTEYLDKPIGEKIIKEVFGYLNEKDVEAHLISDRKIVEKIAELVYEAHMFAFGDIYFKEELAEWVRSIYSDKKDGMPLFGFGIPGPLTIFGNKMIRYNPARIQSIKDRKLVAKSPAALVLISQYDTRESWLKVGKILEYIFLSLSKNGVSLAPMAGVVEHETSREKLMKLLGTNKMPMFFARTGYASTKVHQSPRIPSSKVII